MIPQPAENSSQNSVTTSYPLPVQMAGRVSSVCSAVTKSGSVVTVSGSHVTYFSHLLRHVRVARADGLEPQLAAEAQCRPVLFKRRAAVEDLHAVKTVHIAQVLAQPAIVAAKGVAGDAEAVLFAHQVDKVLCADALVGDAVDPPGGDIAPERENSTPTKMG